MFLAFCTTLTQVTLGTGLLKQAFIYAGNLVSMSIVVSNRWAISVRESATHLIGRPSGIALCNVDELYSSRKYRPKMIIHG